MSEWVDIPLAVGQAEDSPGGASYVTDAELVNLQFKENPPGSRAPYHIASVPTLKATAISGPTTPGTGVGRGLCRTTNGTLFVIMGTTCYYSTDNGSNWTSIGTMTGSSFCRMVDAGTHVVAVDIAGGNTRCFTTAAVFTPSRENFQDVAYQDGYTIYAERGSDSVYVSSLDDPTTIGALDFTTVDSTPGNVLGLISDHREVFAYKSLSTEHYFNAGGSGFPFQRSSPGLMERGLLNALDSYQGQLTISKHENAIFWAGDDYRVYLMRGNQPQVISTPWVERFLSSQNTSIDNGVMFGFVCSLDGSAYYMLSGAFEDANPKRYITLVYDIRTGLWHKRRAPMPWNSSTVTQGWYLTHSASVIDTGSGWPRVFVLANGSTLVTQTGKIFEFDPTGTNDSDADAQTTRTMTMPQYSPAPGRRTFMPELYLDMQKASAAGNVTLTWSDDGGSTFTSGTTSAANVPRVRWQRLGSFYQRILRFTFSIASRLAIMGVRARVEVGE